MDPTLTLNSHSMHDGTTYTLLGRGEGITPLQAEPLGVSATYEDNYLDGGEVQVNVKTKVHSVIAFCLLVEGATAAALTTALTNLDTWCRAGGPFVFTDGATTLLSCTCGASTPPTRVYTPVTLTEHWTVVLVELVRMT